MTPQNEKFHCISCLNTFSISTENRETYVENLRKSVQDLERVDSLFILFEETLSYTFVFLYVGNFSREEPRALEVLF